MDKHWNINRFIRAGICEGKKDNQPTTEAPKPECQAQGGDKKMKDPTDDIY